jgi:hypothetical protein
MEKYRQLGPTIISFYIGGLGWWLPSNNMMPSP